MRVEGIMATEDNYNLLVETLQDNYGDKTAIKNAHCVALVTMVKPQETASALRTFYDSLMSDMRSLTTLDLPTTRYGDFYVPILLEKLPEKLLTNVLKEYPCVNPTIDQLIEMIHNEVKRLEQVAYISHNNRACKSKPAPPTKAPPPPKPPLPKVPPISGVLGETVPPGTATALPAAVTPSNQSKSKKFKQFKGPRKFHVDSVGLPVPTTHFNVNFLSRIEFLQLNPSSCASIFSEGVMPLLNVNHSSDVQFVGNPITLHFMELQVFNHH